MITVGQDPTDLGTGVSDDSILGPVVFDAIRAVHPYTPILIFGGTHCVFGARNHSDI